jgi:UDP-N-acetylglucosamine diphosphorylase / glucose-1-phosphate thymidylyltransferase / UDP-N-acetylgalactosamine diphosphorylase / glucosamine-1-phosphate N-acetyltransferase / galactosamine-1-phosphate N-acetyltransferase
MQAVLMVAGKSTRTYPLTLTRPKPLLPIMNRALIRHSLDQLTGLFDQVIFITGYKKEAIEEELGDNYRGMQLVYQEQREQKGTGHAVLQAKEHITGKFVAMNGDDLFARQDIENLIKYDYAALAKRVPDPSLYGVFHVDEKNRVHKLVEKPKEYLGDLANIGGYVLQPDFFAELENTPLSERGEIEITSAVDAVAQRQDVYAMPIEGFWLPTGFAWDLLKHQEFLMQELSDSDIQGLVEEGATLKGSVQVGKGTVIKSGAYIEGPAIIGENCVIGPNCHIRKYTSIGDNCTIGQAVEIKNSLVMNSCHIQHLSYIGDSVVGEGCNIGAGTITANRRHDKARVHSTIKEKLVDSERAKFGAIFSDGVETGVHTTIYPGRKIWPNMTTLPGEIIKRDKMPDGFEW